MLFRSNGPGGNHLLNLNPVHHFGDSIAWFRTFVAWASTIAFLLKVSSSAEEYFRATATANQSQAPDVTILGNAVGKLIAPIYIAIILAGTLAFVAVVVSLLDGAAALNGQQGFVAALNAICGDPFQGLGADAVRMLDCFFPLGLLAGQTVFLLSMRPVLVSAYWVYSMVIRVLTT